MKYGWKNFTSQDVAGVTGRIIGSGSILNTPTHCVTVEGHGDPFTYVTHQGLNLTPEGEWIAAPGLPRKQVVDLTPEQLQEFYDHVAEINNNADKQANTLDRAAPTIAPTPQIFQPECEMLNDKLAIAKLSIEELEGSEQRLSDRIGELMGRLSAIEQWATKPCVDVKLRLAQAHVLKLVRGEV